MSKEVDEAFAQAVPEIREKRTLQKDLAKVRHLGGAILREVGVKGVAVVLLPAAAVTAGESGLASTAAHETKDAIHSVLSQPSAEDKLMDQVHKHPGQFVIVNEDGGIGVNDAAKELAPPNTSANDTLRSELGAQANETGGLDAGEYVVRESAITIPQPKAAEMPVVQGFVPMNKQ